MRRIFCGLVVPLVSFAGLQMLDGPVYGGERGIRASEVPKAVGDVVRKRYPRATILRYVRDDEDGNVTYEVSIRDDGAAEDVTVSPDGRILTEERRVAKNDLPVEVRATLAAELQPKGRVVTIERIVDPEHETEVKFEVMLRRGGDLIELTFDKAGRIVKREIASRGR